MNDKALHRKVVIRFETNPRRCPSLRERSAHFSREAFKAGWAKLCEGAAEWKRTEFQSTNLDANWALRFLRDSIITKFTVLMEEIAGPAAYPPVEEIRAIEIHADHYVVEAEEDSFTILLAGALMGEVEKESAEAKLQLSKLQEALQAFDAEKATADQENMLNHAKHLYDVAKASYLEAKAEYDFSLLVESLILNDARAQPEKYVSRLHPGLAFLYPPVVEAERRIFR